MQKIKKLILTSGISLSSLFFNSAYSQEKGNFSTGTYQVDGKTYSHKYETSDGKGGTWIRYYNTDGKSPSVKDISSWKFVNKPQNSQTSQNKSIYIPPATKTNSDLGNALLIGGAAIGTLWLINELAKPRYKTPVYYSAPPVNNPPVNYNSNPEDNKKAFDEWLNGKEETENKKAFDEWLNGKEETENKKAFDEWLNGKESNKIKSLDEVLKEQEQKKAETKIHAEKMSRELSDFVEKQAEASPETKIWFDKEYQEAEAFYKEFYKNDPEAYARVKDLDKLHKVIGYNSYKLAKEYTPVGPVLEGMEIYEDIKEKGMENYWKDEVKEADEFLKQYEQNSKLKNISNEKNLEEKLGTDIYVPKFREDKYSEQINKIAYESDVAKVIRYRAYQYAKNNTEAGKVIEGIEKVDEMKKDDSKFFWDE